MAPRSSSMSSSRHPSRNGTSTPQSCCCCHTATKVRDLTTRRHVSSGSCSYLQRTTCGLCNRPTVQTTSICCANTLMPAHAVQWLCLVQNSCCVCALLLHRWRTSPRVASCRLSQMKPHLDRPSSCCWSRDACTTTWCSAARHWAWSLTLPSCVSNSSTHCQLPRFRHSSRSTPTPRSPGFKMNQQTRARGHSCCRTCCLILTERSRSSVVKLQLHHPPVTSRATMKNKTPCYKISSAHSRIPHL